MNKDYLWLFSLIWSYKINTKTRLIENIYTSKEYLGAHHKIEKLIFIENSGSISSINSKNKINHILQPNLMKKIILLLIFLCQFNPFLGQKKEIDSLKNHFSTIKSDSLKSSEVLKAITFYYKKGDLEVYRKLIEYDLKRESSHNKTNIAKKLLMFGRYYKKKGILDSAMFQYNKSLSLFKELKDDAGIVNVNSSIANVLKSKGDFRNAIIKYNETLSFYEKDSSKNRRNILSIKLNLGSLYGRLEDWKKAEALNEEVFKNPIIKKNNRMYSSICINLVGIKTKLKKYKEALKFAKISEKIEKRTKSLGNLYNNIGSIFVEQLNYKEADVYYKKSLQQYQKIGSNDGVLKSFNNLGNNLTKWGKLNEAEKYLLKSNKILIKKGEPSSLIHNYKMLRDLYVKKENYKLAYNYYHLSQELKDSILGFEKQKAIADIEIKYETEKTKREKAAVEQQVEITKLESQKNKKLFLGSIFIAVLLLLSSLFYFGRIKAKKKTELIAVELKETQKRLALEQQSRDSELKALKAQMNPHFMFNALNSIQDLVLQQNTDDTYDYIVLFAELIRNTLNYSNKEFIPIEKELEFLNVYLQLEKLRFGDSFSYTISYDEKESIEVPSLLIQPFIENALVHGLMHKTGKKNLEIILTFDNAILECIIVDNGIGRKKATEIGKRQGNQHESFALSAIKKRLEIFKKNNNKKVGYTIEDLYKGELAVGTKVILTMPFYRQF
jgi:Tfp pilus assembly protein PilF